MSNTKVSVLTPVFNTHIDHLRQCIDSILNQTFTDFEFIILNDSPDNIELEQLILSYTDKRIKYHKNDKNIGISESRNKLLCGAYNKWHVIKIFVNIICMIIIIPSARRKVRKKLKRIFVKYDQR